MNISVAEAKAKFSELLKLAEAGERIVVTRHGKPIAEITAPKTEEKKSILGLMEGKIWIADDFDEPLEDFKDYM